MRWLRLFELFEDALITSCENYKQEDSLKNVQKIKTEIVAFKVFLKCRSDGQLASTK
jgi:hypothetical protein